jgi:RNA polymerase sigma factor (sigma-70 family)
MQLRHLSDEDLVEEARAGSDAAFAALYVRYQRAVYARCFAVLRDHDEAADASQNAMLNALRALRRDGSPANLRGWLLTIAHNEAVSLLRRTRPTEPLDHGHGGAGPGADEGAFARERLRQLVDDLNALPDRQRGALLLREASGYSYRRIASALGTSTGNARQTVHQARRNLHKRRVGREHGWLGWALPGLAGAWLLRVLGLEELAANSLNAGKAALLAGALVVGGGAASQVAGGGALLGAATPSAFASAPPAHALAALPRRLGHPREVPAVPEERRPATAAKRITSPTASAKAASTEPTHEPSASKPAADRTPAVEPVATAEPAQPRPARDPPTATAAAHDPCPPDAQPPQPAAQQQTPAVQQPDGSQALNGELPSAK